MGTRARGLETQWRFVCTALLAIVIVFSPIARARDGSSARSDPQDATSSQSSNSSVNPRWLDRLPNEDRALVDENIGFAPPALTGDLKWFGGEPVSWDALRGKVIVLHSWTSKSSAGRRVPERLAALRRVLGGVDVVFLAMHTPEGADTVDQYLERHPPAIPVAVDAEGKYCDAVGFYRRPTNIIIDRNGVVRYAGLKLDALDEAVGTLLEESVDNNISPKHRPGAGVDGNAEFPKPTNVVRHVKDIRNQRAPDFFVEQWVNAEATPGKRVVVIDFWATWCGPCVGAIPHMNALAEKYADDVVCIGISDESADKFKAGMENLRGRNITMDTFKYHIALDTQKRMSKQVGVQGIPHVIVISSDWIVRWQGHPMELDEETLGRIVAANRAMQSGGPARNRWANSKKS